MERKLLYVPTMLLPKPFDILSHGLGPKQPSLHLDKPEPGSAVRGNVTHDLLLGKIMGISDGDTHPKETPPSTFLHTPVGHGGHVRHLHDDCDATCSSRSVATSSPPVQHTFGDHRHGPWAHTRQQLCSSDQHRVLERTTAVLVVSFIEEDSGFLSFSGSL